MQSENELFRNQCSRINEWFTDFRNFFTKKVNGFISVDLDLFIVLQIVETENTKYKN